jgi:hypothetical protein
MPLNISQFKIQQVAFQVRYRDAFLIFDKTGSLSEEARKRWPTMKIEKGEPRSSSFTVDNKYRLQVEIDKASIIAFNPKPSLEEFIDDAHAFEEIIRNALEIVEYNRVGFKTFYRKEHETNEDATMDIVSSFGLKLPQGKHFNIEGKIPLVTLEHRWEDELLCVTSQLRSQEQSWEFTPPIEAEGLEPKKTKINFVSYAPDYFTRKSISVNQLNVKKWIENAFHLIKRDSKIFLEK